MQLNGQSVRLVRPDVERDAPLSVTWLEGEEGRRTLRLMGVTAKDNKPPSLKREQARIRDFLTKKIQLNWMIETDQQIVGAIWADLEPTKYLPAPAVHIMIGDPSARGKGTGSQAMSLVLDFLHNKGYETVYSRHLLANAATKAMNKKFNFLTFGNTYKDADGLEWQNVLHKRS